MTELNLDTWEWSTVRLTRTAWGSLDELGQRDPSGYQAVAGVIVALDQQREASQYPSARVRIGGLTQTVHTVGRYRLFTTTEIEPSLVLVLGVLDVGGHDW